MSTGPAETGMGTERGTDAGTEDVATTATAAPAPAPATAVDADADEQSARNDRAELRRGLLYCLLVFVSLRVVLSVAALVATALLPNAAGIPDAARSAAGIPGPVSVPGWAAHGITPGWHNLWTPFERFDALWFLRIATGGYASGDGSAAFFPFYPWLIKVVTPLVGGHPVAAATLVSNLCFLGALMMLYVLGRTELGDTTARRAVVYAAIFPTSFFFLAPYSESTFLLLALVCLWAARRGRWEVAAAAGAGAALTRSIGIVLVLPLAVEAVQSWREAGRPGIPIRGLAWSLGPAAGTLLYLSYWQRKAGDWLAPLHQQATWERTLTNPIATLWHATQYAIDYTGVYAGGYHQLDWLVTVPTLALAGYAVWRLRPVYGTYVVASILPPLCLVFEARPLMSVPRFLVTVFPIFWGAALWTRDRPLRHDLYLVTSCLLLGVLLLLFADWYYVF